MATKTTPYVSTTLHAIWLPVDASTDGCVHAATPLTDGRQGMGKPVPHYRLTPAVYRWFRRQLSAAEDQAWSANDATAKDMIRLAAAAWAPLADWAEATYPAEELSQAQPALPAVRVTPARTGVA